MKKYICFCIHTERVHDDKLWERIQKILKFFKKFNVCATWFSINPTFVGYRYDEEKWIKRLKHLKEFGQEIQQHTHFYKGKEGVKKGIGYDLGKENVETRLLEDKNWLKEKIGITPIGFVSGVFKINNEVLEILEKENYQYDLSKREENAYRFKRLLEIPTLATLKLFLVRPKFIHFQALYFSTIYFHDFDLAKFFFRIFLKYQVLFLQLLGFKFVSTSELYEKIRDITSSQ